MSKLGLVCLTSSGEPKFRTITKTRLMKLTLEDQTKVLVDIYINNMEALNQMSKYCFDNKIFLYRLSSDLFPFSDLPIGKYLLFDYADRLKQIGQRFRDFGIRLTFHPAQFASLTVTDSRQLRNSIDYLQMHANIMDLLQLDQSPWNPIIIHCGKKDSKLQFIQAVNHLPSNIRNRLVIENDEYSYGAQDVKEISAFTELPVVFDLHHHLIKEFPSGIKYDDMYSWLEIFRESWGGLIPGQDTKHWQLCHISNGKEHPYDRAHSDYINNFPEILFSCNWIEVEAKAKELAIFQLRERYPNELE